MRVLFYSVVATIVLSGQVGALEGHANSGPVHGSRTPLDHKNHKVEEMKAKMQPKRVTNNKAAKPGRFTKDSQADVAIELPASVRAKVAPASKPKVERAPIHAPIKEAQTQFPVHRPVAAKTLTLRAKHFEHHMEVM